MKDYILPLVPVIVPIISALFSLYQQRKVQNSGFLDEQYRYFIAPIYYLLNSSYSYGYINSRIEHILEENPHLIPDGFLDDFSIFKSDCKQETLIVKTDFYKCVINLYVFLRYQLKYSKKHLSHKDKKKAQKYFGKRPSLIVASLISFLLSIISLLFAVPIYLLYVQNSINHIVYYILLAILTIFMLFVNLWALNKYYPNDL